MDVIRWLTDLFAAYGWIAVFCLACGLIGVLLIPLLLLMERVGDKRNR